MEGGKEEGMEGGWKQELGERSECMGKGKEQGNATVQSYKLINHRESQIFCCTALKAIDYRSPQDHLVHLKSPMSLVGRKNVHHQLQGLVGTVVFHLRY